MEFVIWIVGISTLGWLVNNWIRATHGYSLEDEWGGKTAKGDNPEVKTLRAENAELREQLAHFTDRVKVLERIVTDPATNTAAQIEALRDQPKLETRP
jgi:tmRNA-binding protein